MCQRIHLAGRKKSRVCRCDRVRRPCMRQRCLGVQTECPRHRSRRRWRRIGDLLRPKLRRNAKRDHSPHKISSLHARLPFVSHPCEHQAFLQRGRTEPTLKTLREPLYEARGAYVNLRQRAVRLAHASVLEAFANQRGNTGLYPCKPNVSDTAPFRAFFRQSWFHEAFRDHWLKRSAQTGRLSRNGSTGLGPEAAGPNRNAS